MTDAAPPEPRLDAVALAGLLADEGRRRVFAALVLGASTPNQISLDARLDGARSGKALARLVDAGLVVRNGEGALVIQASAFQSAARAAASRRDPGAEDDRPPEVAKVLRAFVVDGRLTAIPAARSKRLVVLDLLAQEFEPGHRYSEAMVNLVLGRRYADTAALRRYLVDEGFLDRAGGEYWRAGGTVDDLQD